MTERLRLSAGASVAELHGEAVVLHLPSGRYFSANGTGATLLRRLAQPDGATRESLAQELVDAYRVDAARARSDVDTWLARLGEAGLLETQAASEGGAPR